jgi:glycosyltransferase involved in cell wall biosynthesis
MLSSLSIVIPAYNEGTTIAATIDDALRIGPRLARELEVIVCDDASTDTTAQILAARRSTEPRLRVLDRRANAGIEASIRTLYAHATCDWVFLISADGEWPMTSLVDMAGAAERGADFVVGVRANKRAIYTPYRRIVSWGYERVVRALGAVANDPGSIKLARRDLLHTAVTARGVFAEGERVIRATRAGARVVEVPVEFNRRAAGQATGARHDVVATAVVDAVRVASSLVIGWPRAVLPKPDV